jgi:hypothetical protein
MLEIPAATALSMTKAAGDGAFVVSGVGRRMGAVIAQGAGCVDAACAQAQVYKPSCQKDADDWNDYLVCGNASNVVADSGRRKSGVSATRRPNCQAISAYIPTRAKTAILASPKQEDLKWLTTISQNRYRIVRTGFPQAQAKDLAWAVWVSFSWASSSCLLCFMLCSEVPRYRLSKTQAASLPQQRLKRRLPIQHQRQCQANNDRHSRTCLTLKSGGRGGTLAPRRADFSRSIPVTEGLTSASLRAPIGPIPIDLSSPETFNGGTASLTEVRPC